MLQRLRRITFVLIFLVSMAGTILLTAATRVPDFYQQQMVAADDVQVQVQATQFEQTINDLAEAAQTDGDWRVVLTDTQINAWLATNLQASFPRLVPIRASEPRVKISSDTVQLACKYKSNRVTAILSLAFQPLTTNRPNTIGIKICDARVGAVPGLMQQAMEQISIGALRSGIKLGWIKHEDSPVAIIELPAQLVDGNQRITFNHIICVDGQLQISGTTITPTSLLQADLSTQPSAAATQIK